MKNLKWVPNAITSARALLIILAFVFVLKHNLAPAFWLFLLAISTDFLDGLAARKLKVTSKFGGEFDAYVDSLTVLLGVLGLSIAGYYPWWVTISVAILGIVLGISRQSTAAWLRHRTIFAVASLFSAWIGILWSYAYLAFGWSWLYVVLTVFIITSCGLLKKHRITAWLKYS